MSIIFDRLKYGKETIDNLLYDNKYSYGKIIVDNIKCTGCNECINECVVNAITEKDGKPIIDLKKCIYCGNCIDLCENDALENSHDYKMSQIEEAGAELKEKIYKRFNRSLVLRSVDTGSCNACMLELSAMQNNYYALSRFGVDFAASPRHSDGIVVTGPVTINMKEALIKTYHATSKPRIVIAIGACTYDGGIFKDCYGTMENLDELLPVDLVIPGCPPSPQAMIFGILKLLNKI
jgi:Ni,Fe-hydrogenase III small subunit/NAD-dependent dihydropyrimidine dehydrogenase PreA subunit